MSLQEHDLRLIEDFIAESISKDSLEEFAVKKATSKEFYDMLTMQDEVLHDLTEDLYKVILSEQAADEHEEHGISARSLSFDAVGMALIVLSALGIATMSLILLAINHSPGIF